MSGTGDGAEDGILGARAVGGKGDTLAGSVETGIDGDLLAFGEWADGECLRGDAGRIGERGGVALRGDPFR